MDGHKLEITIGGQPLGVSYNTEQIDVAVAKETVHVHNAEDGIHFTIREEKPGFSSPLVLAVPGWPFGPNPNRVEGLAKGVVTVVDEAVMPTYYRVAKWLFLISDDDNDLAVTSEIKCMRRGDDVYFIEYAIIGDSGTIQYDLDAVLDGDRIQLLVTSQYNGVLTVRTSKIGIFN